MAVIFCLFLVYGLWQLNYRKNLQVKDQNDKEKNIKVGLVQPYLNFEQPYNSQSATEYYYSLTKLSWKLRKEAPQLVIWPETAIPYYYEYHLAQKFTTS